MGERTFDHMRLGRSGEDRALFWYLQRGYRLVARNWRCTAGEVDLIVAQGDDVVFVEVKTRSSDRYGTPFEAVGVTKQRRIRRIAAAWLAANRTSRSRAVRFDVAAVMGGTVEVREGVF